MDESAKHLLQDKRESLPMQKGLPERVDDTFESKVLTPTYNWLWLTFREAG